MKKYSVRDSFSGSVIEYADSIEEAKRIIEEFEQEDIDTGLFQEDFYVIYDNELKTSI